MLGKTFDDPTITAYLARYEFQPQHNKPFDENYTNVALGTSMRQYIVPVYFLVNNSAEIELAKLFLPREFVDDAEVSAAAYEISKAFLALFLPGVPVAQDLINELTWRNFRGDVAYIEFSDILSEQLPPNPAASFLTFIGEQDECRLENPDGTILFLENNVVGTGERYLSLFAGTKNAFAALFGE